MKRITIIITSLLALGASIAQTQLPNANFEQWTSTASGNAVPKYWHSFADADCNLKGIYSWGCPCLLKNHSNRVAGHSGYGCEIYSDFVGGVALVNGVLTTGQMRFATPETKSEENHNYTDKDNKSGHHAAIPFTGRPDSVYFWCKFIMKKPSNVATAKFHLHGNVSYKDICTHQSGTPQKGKVGNAFCEFTDPNDQKWHQYRYKFTYFDEQNNKVSSTAIRPNYILVTFSTNKITKGGSTGDKLIIDDITMVYNKRLAVIEVDGLALPNFDSDVHDYVLCVAQGELPEITATAQSPNATVRVEQATRKNGNTAVITVKHDDGEDYYIVHFITVGNLAETVCLPH